MHINGACGSRRELHHVLANTQRSGGRCGQQARLGCVGRHMEWSWPGGKPAIRSVSPRRSSAAGRAEIREPVRPGCACMSRRKVSSAVATEPAIAPALPARTHHRFHLRRAVAGIRLDLRGRGAGAVPVRDRPLPEAGGRCARGGVRPLAGKLGLAFFVCAIVNGGMISTRTGNPDSFRATEHQRAHAILPSRSAADRVLPSRR